VLLGQARLGWQENWRKATIQTRFAHSCRRNRSGMVAGLPHSTSTRPTASISQPSGWFSTVKYFDSPASGFSRLDAGASGYLSVGDWVLASRLSYQGSPVGELPVYDLGQLGGMLNMTAFAVGQLKGDDMSYGNMRAERIIGRLPLGLRGDLRLGAALETAKVGTPFTETKLKGWINSTAIYLGGETPLGPVYLGYGYSKTGSIGGLFQSSTCSSGHPDPLVTPSGKSMKFGTVVATPAVAVRGKAVQQ
jgi:NTE family protein